MLKKYIYILIFAIACLYTGSASVYAKDYVVVLDPGHGGDSLGGHNETFEEKYLDFETAKHLKERLEQYEGVKVYLTRDDPDDTNTSLKERAILAEDLNADYLFSIHYNMSENHNIFGCEVWTSAFGDAYVQGQQFGSILVEDLSNQCGFFNRGVKTRLGEKEPDKDYYGIIRESLERDIIAVIIEHCHMDEERDVQYLLNEKDPYKQLGIIDADAIAKFLKLKSEKLGIDNSIYTLMSVDKPSSPVGSDLTPPESCDIKLLERDEENRSARISISSKDNDSYVQYYSYSVDGGHEFGKLYPWSSDMEAKSAEDNTNIVIEVPLFIEAETKLIVRSYNQYDRMTQSSMLVIEGIHAEPDPVEEFIDITSDINISDRESSLEFLSTSNVILLIVFVFVSISILGLIIVLIWISHGRKKNSRNSRIDRR